MDRNAFYIIYALYKQCQESRGGTRRALFEVFTAVRTKMNKVTLVSYISVGHVYWLHYIITSYLYR